MNFKNVFLFLALLNVLFFLSACGAVDYFLLKEKADTPRELVEAGQRALQEKDYDEAAEHFSKLKEEFPFSPYALQAELGLADAYFLDGKFMAAEDAYKEFESMHPGSEEIPYVLFQIGKANFKQFKSVDLPQENTAEALQYFQRVRQSHPDSPLGRKAEEYINKCRKFQAEHEIYVADFYWRVEEYLSAWKRYEYVSKNFSDFEEIYECASKRSELAYYKYQKQQSEQKRISQHNSWKWLLEWL